MKTLGDVSFALVRFLDHHLRGLDTCERVSALASYCQGLALDGVRKSLVAMASRLEPGNVEGCRQRMHRALHRGRFSHREVFERVQATAWKHRQGLRAFCIDDTGFAKKGELSVGTKRQYSGTLGKTGNCQVAVSLHAVGPRQSLCLDMGLYLPQEWAENPERRRQAEVPEEVQFATKAEIALAQLQQARERGAPSMPVLADAGYGDSRAFRESLEDMGLPYLMALSSTGLMWPPGSEPQVPRHTGMMGRPCSRARDPNGQVPTALATLAQKAWARGAFRPVFWGRGSKGPKEGSFCLLAVRSAEGHTKGRPPSKPLQLLLERDPTQTTGFKYYLTDLPRGTGLKRLVTLAKLRWRIERDYQDMKQYLGLDSYVGRRWGGVHRHFAMVALMHAFLALHKEGFSPSTDRSLLLDSAGLPQDDRAGPPPLVAAVSYLHAPV